MKVQATTMTHSKDHNHVKQEDLLADRASKDMERKVKSRLQIVSEGQQILCQASLETTAEHLASISSKAVIQRAMLLSNKSLVILRALIKSRNMVEFMDMRVANKMPHQC